MAVFGRVPSAKVLKARSVLLELRMLIARSVVEPPQVLDRFRSGLGVECRRMSLAFLIGMAGLDGWKPLRF